MNASYRAGGTFLPDDAETATLEIPSVARQMSVSRFGRQSQGQPAARSQEAMGMKPTVFVVDPDPRTAKAVQTLVRSMDWRCSVFASGNEFQDAYEPFQPGCVVLEAVAPSVNGLQIQQALNDRGATSPVIFVTDSASVSTAARAMRAGALHFLEKPFAEHELWDAVQEAIRVDHERLARRAKCQQLAERLSQLTEKESVVLEMLAQGQSKQTIASALGVCVRTVELRRNRIMRKLQAYSILDLLPFALVAQGHALPPAPHFGMPRTKKGGGGSSAGSP